MKEEGENEKDALPSLRSRCNQSTGQWKGSHITIMVSFNPVKITFFFFFYKNHIKIVLLKERGATIISLAMQPDSTANLREKKFT